MERNARAWALIVERVKTMTVKEYRFAYQQNIYIKEIIEFHEADVFGNMGGKVSEKVANAPNLGVAQIKAIRYQIDKDGALHVKLGIDYDWDEIFCEEENAYKTSCSTCYFYGKCNKACTTGDCDEWTPA